METHFTIPGKPQGKARPRVRRDGHAYTPTQTAQYEEFVRFCWRCAGAVKLDGAIRALILARCPVPKRDSKKTQDAKIVGEIPCTIKPDCDNIAKIVLDALNGLAYDDDSQVTELEVHKLYGDIGDVFVRLEEIKEEKNENKA